MTRRHRLTVHADLLAQAPSNPRLRVCELDAFRAEAARSTDQPSLRIDHRHVMTRPPLLVAHQERTPSNSGWPRRIAPHRPSRRADRRPQQRSARRSRISSACCDSNRSTVGIQEGASTREDIGEQDAYRQNANQEGRSSRPVASCNPSLDKQAQDEIEKTHGTLETCLEKPPPNTKPKAAGNCSLEMPWEK